MFRGNQIGWSYYGNHGASAIVATSPLFDLSGLSDPRFEVILGQGGAGGSSPRVRGNERPGQPGSNGFASWTYTLGRKLKADVLPLEPTAQGSFAKTAEAGSFPDLGAGFWQLHTVANTQLDLGALVIAPGITMNYSWATAASFVSARTPTYGAGAARTIHYKFYSMGSWG